MKRNNSTLRLLVAALPVTLSVGCAADPEAADPDSGVVSVGGTAAAGDGSSTGVESPQEMTDSAATDGGDTGAGGSETAGPESPIKLDVGSVPDAPDFNNCGAPSPVVCDAQDDDPWHALGVNCAGGPQVDGTIMGAPAALYVHEGNLGTYIPATYPPREGNKFVVLSSGNAAEIAQAGLYASTSHPGQDPGNNLPAPIMTNDVSPFDDCAGDPSLIGAGDCSNTIATQWNQGSGANDYVEMRINTVVPANTFGFSYDLAFFSTEYPVYYQSTFNDMYIAWLESEQWTGNVSFDDMGNPISLNAGFLDFKDAPNPFDCPACTAPELQGTAMEGHAGTRWLTTSAGVTPGETIEIVFAVFDLTDNSLDSVVLLDNWHWACEGGPPITIPG